MELCTQCGSASRDMQGFCRGCGARFTPDSPVGAAGAPKKTAEEPTHRLQGKLAAFGDDNPLQRNIGTALGLTLLLGPVGMVYSTIPGAIVMSIVSLAAPYFLGRWALFIVWPVCLVWAGYAAWKSGQMY
jgi:hypothetical protein